MAGKKRTDSKGRILKDGESQRPDGTYRYRYTDATGKRRDVYSSRLVATDKPVPGSKSELSLREKEKLINGTKSCGCLRRKPAPSCIDLTGQTFGMLTVLYKDQTAEAGKAKWMCRCECGRLTSVLSESLRNGSTKSCGCIVTKLKHDLVGMEFGHLLVLERTYDSRFVSKDTRWKCLCQNCGRTVSVGSRNLRTGNPYGHCKCTRNKKQKNGVQS